MENSSGGGKAAPCQVGGTETTSDAGSASACPAAFPQYRCHKVVGALKIKSSDWVSGWLHLTPEEEGFAPFTVDEDWVRRWSGHAIQGGYYVVYSDGYASWSPAKAFEDGYTLADKDPYQELIYAVESAFPGETRHETALRYIRNAERQCHGPAQSA